MTRFEAFLLLRRRVRDRGLVKRCLAVEALMEDLASRLGGDAEIWGLAGLLHEVDAEFTENNPKSKGRVAADIMRSDGGPAEVVRALQDFRGPGPHADPMTRALAAAVPAAMILLDLVSSPEELEALESGELPNAPDDPSIAPGASRARIHDLEEAGLDAQALLELARTAVLRVAADVF
jgi:putative nucleotidyltransferase with HDIG domain